MHLAYVETQEGITIRIYQNYNPAISFLDSKFERICKQIFKHPLVKKLGNIDIIFELNPPIRQDFIRAMELDSNREESGHVSYEDVSKGSNILTLREDAILVRSYLEHQKTAGNLGTVKHGEPIIFSADVIERAVRITIGVIVHEMTHLWHLRRNHMLGIMKKNKDKIAITSTRMRQNFKLFEGNMSLANLWMFLRTMLLSIIERIIVEGIARYAQDYATGKIELNQRSLRRSYAIAYKLANKVNKELSREYSATIKLIRLSTEGRTTIESIYKELIERYKGIEIYCYEIGMHVYHSVFFAYHRIPEDRIVNLGYSQLIYLYEEACKHLGWKPVISFRSKDGVFSYKNHLQMLRTLRKETDKFL